MKELEGLSIDSLVICCWGRAVNSLIFQMLQALAGTLWEPEKPSGKELQVLAVESSLIGMHRNGECPKDKGRSPTVCAAG